MTRTQWAQCIPDATQRCSVREDCGTRGLKCSQRKVLGSFTWPGGIVGFSLGVSNYKGVAPFVLHVLPLSICKGLTGCRDRPLTCVLLLLNRHGHTLGSLGWPPLRLCVCGVLFIKKCICVSLVCGTRTGGAARTGATAGSCIDEGASSSIH